MSDSNITEMILGVPTLDPNFRAFLAHVTAHPLV
jgi:hypothetical protein